MKRYVLCHVGEDLQNWICEEGKKKRKNEMQLGTDGKTLSRWHSSAQAAKKTIEGALERLRRVQMMNNNDNLKQQHSNKTYKSNSTAVPQPPSPPVTATRKILTFEFGSALYLHAFRSYIDVHTCACMCIFHCISCFSFVMDRFLFWLLL